MRPLTVGEEIYIVQRSTWGRSSYLSATVTKVTPTGIATVRIGENYIRQFNPDGHERGNRWHGFSIDDMPVAERKTFLAKQDREDAATEKIKEIKENIPDFKYGSKETLSDLINKLQGQLTEARRLVDAI
jgi:hypothetical protein